MKKKQNKQNKSRDFAKIIGYLMGIMALVCLFWAVWLDGWNILKMLITSLLFFIWGGGIVRSCEESELEEMKQW